MARKAEVIFVGDAVSVEHAAAAAARAVEASQAKIGAAADKGAAAQEAASARTVKAHERAAKSAAQSAEAFGKWGTVAGGAIIGVSAKLAVDVETAATAIAKAGGTSTEAGKKIEDAFRKIPGTVEYSGQKIGAAFATIAGEMGAIHGHALNAAESVKVMGAALDLTDASGGDLTKTTEALGKTLFTYGLGAKEAAKASDILFNASKQTGTSIEEVSQVVNRMHGRLGILAPSLAETGGLMEEFAKHGLKGREALSSLNGVYTTLIGESKKTEAVISELGLTLVDHTGKFVGLKNVIGQLEPVLAKYNQHTQLEYASALFGAQAAKKLLGIIHEGPAAYEAATKAVQRHGAATDAATKEHGTLAGKLKATKASMENLSATLGEALIPALTKVAGALSDGIKWLQKHKDAAKALAIVIGGVLGAAMVDFAVVKVAKFVGGISKMIDAIKLLAGTFGLIPKAAATATAETATAEEALAAKTATTAAAVDTSAVAMGASFLKILGPIALVAAAIQALEHPQKGSLIEGGKSELQEHIEAEHPDWFRHQHEAEGQPGFTAPTSNQATNHRGTRPETRNTVVSEAAAKYGLDPKVLFGVWGNETSFGHNVTTSSAGAQGDFQFIPGTARAYHYPLTNHPNAKQFREQAEASAHYLKDLIKQNHGNVNAALQQYSGNTPGYAEKAQKEAEGYGSGTGPSVEELTAHAKKPKKAPGEGYVDPFFHASGVHRSRTDQGVDFSFRGSLGAVGKGRIVNIVQDPGGFGTEIVEELTEGPHKGQFVYYGLETGATSLTRMGASVKAGRALARGKGTGGIELGFASGSSGVPITPYGPGQSHEHPTVGGEQFSKFLSSIGKSGSPLSVASAEFEKAAAHLILTPMQERLVKGLIGAASSAHAEAGLLAGFATEAGGLWQHTRGLQDARAKPLGTTRGNTERTLIDRQDVATAKAEKIYYAREVAALDREAKAWGKLRASYLKFARHATGNAKKEALQKAAAYAGKIAEAKSQAKALHGTIQETDIAIETAETVLTTTLPGEIQSADLSNYQSANSKVDAEVRAGIKTEAEGKAAKEANARSALAGGYGALSEEGVLQVKGDLREFSKATTEATAALEAHTEALKESAKALKEFAAIGEAIGVVEAGSLAKSLADTVSGQIAGVDYHGRRLTAGSGVAAAY